MIIFTYKSYIVLLKSISLPKMVIYALFSPIVASRWYALKKETPLSVRRPGGVAKGGTESVHRNIAFFIDGLPYLI